MENELKSERPENDRSYQLFLRLFVFALFIIPVAAFLLGNWWLCFGIAFFIVGSWIGWFIIVPLLVYAAWYWFTAGFSFTQYGTFFLACSLAGYLFFMLARRRIFKTSNSGGNAFLSKDHVKTGPSATSGNKHLN